MPRINHGKLGGSLIVLAILYFLWSQSGSHTDFRGRTEQAMSMQSHYKNLGKDFGSDAEMTAQAQKDLDEAQRHRETLMAENHAEIPLSPPEPEDESPRKGTSAVEEVSVAGRKTMPKPVKDVAKDKSKDALKEKPMYPNPDVREDEEEAQNGGQTKKKADPAMEFAKKEMDRILKKSPMIIFSKTMCPYSRRAKSLLLETYKIVPPPYVVELDMLTQEVPLGSAAEPVTLGRALQNYLGESTKRRTVPNILVNGISIGGSDDVIKLDKDGTLRETIEKYGKPMIKEVTKRDL